MATTAVFVSSYIAISLYPYCKAFINELGSMMTSLSDAISSCYKVLTEFSMPKVSLENIPVEKVSILFNKCKSWLSAYMNKQEEKAPAEWEPKSSFDMSINTEPKIGAPDQEGVKAQPIGAAIRLV